MMTEQQRSAMQAAADTLDAMANGHWVTANEARARSAALRAALAQQGQAKPSAWIDDSDHPRHISYLQSAAERRLYGPLRPLYEAPPQRKSLTDEQIDAITKERWGSQLLGAMVAAHREYARAIERELLGDEHE